MTVSEAIYQALGAASMCWNPRPTGVFDSEKAVEIGKELQANLWRSIPDGQVPDGSTSDGYHTFDELYDHRMALTAALAKAYRGWAWRSKQHHPDGEPMFDGFFIVGIDLPNGTITYHYKLEHWDLFKEVVEREYAPKWDGHTPADVVQRLKDWSSR